MTPESVGFKTNNMVLGKHSGRHAFENRVKELGYDILKEDIQEAFIKFKELADKKKEISDKDIEAILNHGRIELEEKYKLKSFNVSTGNKITSTATVSLEIDGQVKEEAACGDGPVNALYNAIERLLGSNREIKDYNINAITSGADALGEVSIKLASKDKIVIGRGVSTDVIEASVLAYINALNKE